MRAATVFTGLGGLGLFFFLSAGCSSSSTPVTTDAGKGSDAARDVGAKDSGAKDAATGTCKGLDAGFSGLTFPAACETCVSQHCCSQALACASTTGCKPIEECAATCVAGGTAAQTCAEHCILGDGGNPNKLNAGQTAAETLDLCLASNCSGDCT